MGDEEREDGEIPGEPMVEDYETGTLELELSDEEYRVLIHSFVPNDMNQKWMYFHEDDWLHVKRSWNGHCVLQARIEVTDGGHRVTDYRIDTEYVRGELPYGDEELDAIAKQLVERMAQITTRTEYVVEDGVLTPASVDRDFD